MSRSCLALSTRVLGSMLLGVVPSVNYSITLCALEIRVCTPSGVFNIQLLGILLFSNHLAKSVLPIMASCLSQSPASHKIRAPFPPEDWLRKSCGVKPYIARKIVENMQEKAEKVCAAGGRGDGIPARTTAKDVTPVKDSTTVVIDKFRSTPLQDHNQIRVLSKAGAVAPITPHRVPTTLHDVTARAVSGGICLRQPNLN